MALVEIARFTDVYEADLAAAFLRSHDIEASVTERFQTTVDPLMQRALGIRVMVPASQADQARDLLARARAGEFAEDEGDDIDAADPGGRAAGSVLAIAAYATGGFWGTSLPRRVRPIAWQGIILSCLILGALLGLAFLISELALDPP